MHRIHIVGCGPRTGTTLLTEMMVSSYEIDLYEEHDRRIANLPPRKGEVYLTKSPKDIIVIAPILKMMKNLYVIYLLRDPRDMIVSMHGSDQTRYWSNLAYWKNYMPFYEALKDHPRFLMIRYEDMVHRPDEVQAKISEKMPFLRTEHKFSEYHRVSKPSPNSLKALRGLRPVSSNSIGNWRKHKSRVLGQIQKHGSITEDLIKFGYEPDDSWEKELEGVQPDLNESHPSKFWKKEFIQRKQRGKYLRAARVWLYHTSVFLWVREGWYQLKKLT